MWFWDEVCKPDCRREHWETVCGGHTPVNQIPAIPRLLQNELPVSLRRAGKLRPVRTLGLKLRVASVVDGRACTALV